MVLLGAETGGGGIKHRPSPDQTSRTRAPVTTPYPLNRTRVVLPLQYYHKMERAKPPVKDLSTAKPLARNISNDLSISQLLQYFKNPVIDIPTISASGR